MGESADTVCGFGCGNLPKDFAGAICEIEFGGRAPTSIGQTNLYLNYAREHWTNPDENPPIGLILCSAQDAAVAHYSLGNLGNQILAREYQLALPTEEQLAKRLEATRRQLDH